MKKGGEGRERKVGRKEGEERKEERMERGG